MRTLGLLVMMVVVGWSQSMAYYTSEGENKVRFLKTSFKEVVAQAKQENKIIFFDAYTTWCGPCKKMDKEVFTDQSVIDLFDNGFVNAKFDMEAGEGPELKDKYEVAAFPTFLFIDASTQEVVHKIVGYYPADKLIAEANKVLEGGEQTLSAFDARFENGERSDKFLLDYIEILDQSYNRTKVAEVAQAYLESKPYQELLDKSNWELFQSYITNPYSGLFGYFQNHQTEFGQAYGESAVVNKLKGAYLIYARSTFFKKDKNYQLISFDKKAFKEYVGYVKDQNLPNEEEIQIELQIMRAQETGDWPSYIKLIEDGLDAGTVAGSDMALYNYALVIDRQKEMPKKCAYVAAEWAAECVARSSMPQATDAYNKLYSSLLDKAGLSQEAEKVRQQLK